jgi:putative transposase
MLFEVEIDTEASLRSHDLVSQHLSDRVHAASGLGLWFAGVVLCHRLHAEAGVFFRRNNEWKAEVIPSCQIADSELQNISFHYSNVRLDSAIVMPNHVHAIIVIDGRGCYSADLGADGVPAASKLGAPATPKLGAPAITMLSLSSIVRSYKSGVTRLCKAHRFQNFAWQPRFYDHVLRTNASVNAVRDYIQNNPANWIHDKDNPKNQTAR